MKPLQKKKSDRTFSLVSLGCPKNLIDSETIAGRLCDAGWRMTSEIVDSVDLIVLNTCAFLESARDEAFRQIDSLIELKRQKITKNLIVAGCLINQNVEGLPERFPLVDAWLSPFDEYRVVEIAEFLLNSQRSSELTKKNPTNISRNDFATDDSALLNNDLSECSKNRPSDDENDDNRADKSITRQEVAVSQRATPTLPLFYFQRQRNLTLDDRLRKTLTVPHVAYLKIADGCDRFCSYCSIPFIRGRFVSKTEQEIVDESKRLADQGVRELVLVAQETTFWGSDLYGSPQLTRLLARLKENNDFDWIRVLYTYPLFFDDDLISLFGFDASGENSGTKTQTTTVLPYIDIPLQHCNDWILKKMNRRVGKSEIEELLSRLRERIPKLVLRTTAIVGFPGETDAMFEELVAFMKKWKFERAGVFEFSPEKGTPAFSMEPQISAAVKANRYKTLYRVQEHIVQKAAQSWVGRVVDVIVDEEERDEEGRAVPNLYLGRTYADSPDIDPIVYLTGENITPGKIYSCEIVATSGVDLVAAPL